jgi:hypothetical protein
MVGNKEMNDKALRFKLMTFEDEYKSWIWVICARLMHHDAY